MADNELKIITDEVSERFGILDFENYANILSIISKNSYPRFTIGIFGEWGTGKTTLLNMIMNKIERDNKVVAVWFDAWRYEREEYLAVIPFLRTLKLKLDESENSKTGKWGLVKKGVLRSAAAFITSTKVTYGIKDVVSAETDFGNLADALKGDGSIGDDNSVYYHATGFLEKALRELRKDDKDCRIVVFVDDLDRCFPDKGLEVLESIKSFFDIEGIIYVIGMNAKTIDFLVQKKFESNPAITGLDYMKK